MKRFCAFLLCLMFVFVLSAVPVCATSIGLSPSDLTDQEKESIAKSIALQPLQGTRSLGAIACFDANKEGKYALGFQSATSAAICVYDSNNTYLYGFQFSCDGKYGIEFYKEYIAIYFTRGEIIALYDPDGACVNVYTSNVVPEERTYWEQVLHRNKKSFGEKVYTLERDLGIGDQYSRLVVTNTLGEATVLYDATGDHIVRQVLLIVLIVGFLSLCIWGIYQKMKEEDKEQKEQSA